MASGEFLKAKCEGISDFQLFWETLIIRLDCLLQVPITHTLVSVALQCDNGHTVELTPISCVVKWQKSIVDVSRGRDET